VADATGGGGTFGRLTQRAVERTGHVVVDEHTGSAGLARDHGLLAERAGTTTDEDDLALGAETVVVGDLTARRVNVMRWTSTSVPATVSAAP
jgi:hypothetical protein